MDQFKSNYRGEKPYRRAIKRIIQTIPVTEITLPSHVFHGPLLTTPQAERYLIYNQTPTPLLLGFMMNHVVIPSIKRDQHTMQRLAEEIQDNIDIANHIMSRTSKILFKMFRENIFSDNHIKRKLQAGLTTTIEKQALSDAIATEISETHIEDEIFENLQNRLHSNMNKLNKIKQKMEIMDHANKIRKFEVHVMERQTERRIQKIINRQADHKKMIQRKMRVQRKKVLEALNKNNRGKKRVEDPRQDPKVKLDPDRQHFVWRAIEEGNLPFAEARRHRGASQMRKSKIKGIEFVVHEHVYLTICRMLIQQYPVGVPHSAA